MLLKSKGCNEIQGFRGNCDSQGKLGMCPSLAEPVSGGFPRSNFEMFPVKHFVATVPPEQLQDTCFPFQFHKAGRSCSPPRKAFAFLTTPSVCQKYGTGISLPAARIFEPLCKFIRSFLLLFPANPLGLPVQFLRHPLPFLQSDCTPRFHRVLFG